MSINYQNRVEKIRRVMDEHNIDIFVASRMASLSYLAGVFVPTSHVRSAILIPKQGELKLLTSRYQVARVKHYTWIEDCDYWDPDEKGGFSQVVIDCLKQGGFSKGRIGLEMSETADFGTFLAGEYITLKSELPEASFVEFTRPVNRILMIKEPQEIEFLRRAVEIADFGIEAGRKAIGIGKLETEIAGAAEYATRCAGNEWSWSQTAGTEVGSGYRTEFPLSSAAPPSRKRIQQGDIVQLDISTMYNCYFGDVKATFVLGAPTKEQKKLGIAYRDTAHQILDNLRPGKAVSDIAKDACQLLDKAGYQGKYRPAFGHGIGTSARIPPAITEPTKGELVAETIVVLLVCIVEPGVGGLMLEAPVYVSETGPVLLSKVPLELIEIPIE